MEEEVQLTEPEEQIIFFGELMRQFIHATQEAAAGRMTEVEAMRLGGMNWGALIAVLQLRGLDSDKYSTSFDGNGQLRAVRNAERER